MRYKLGYMDKYPLEVVGSVMENTPMFRITLKEEIDPVRLKAAVKKAMTVWPLFATKVGFDKEYYLETNDQPLVILQAKENERPKTFGKNTNGYPWRITYEGATFRLEWAHCVTDGMGSLDFLKQVLYCYYGMEPEEKDLTQQLALGLEPFFDPKEKGIGFQEDPKGFSFRQVELKYNDYRTDCHTLYAPSSELLQAAHENHSSIACIISLLFSQALRKHLPKKIKKRNVACNMVFDLRRPLHYQTMHNCANYRTFTYVDAYDQKSFSEVAALYKEKLDRERLLPNVTRSISDRIKLFRYYHIFPSRHWLKASSHVIGALFKNTDANFVLSYLGKTPFPESLTSHVENLDFRVWHDTGQCMLAAVDYNGRINLNLCENFKEKGIVEDFMALSAEQGIHWTKTDFCIFEQANFKE